MHMSTPITPWIRNLLTAGFKLNQTYRSIIYTYITYIYIYKIYNKKLIYYSRNETLLNLYDVIKYDKKQTYILYNLRKLKH